MLMSGFDDLDFFSHQISLKNDILDVSSLWVLTYVVIIFKCLTLANIWFKWGKKAAILLTF